MINIVCFGATPLIDTLSPAVRWLEWGSACAGSHWENPAGVGGCTSPQSGSREASGQSGPIAGFAAGGRGRIQGENHVARLLLHKAGSPAAETGPEPHQGSHCFTGSPGDQSGKRLDYLIPLFFR